MRGLVDLNTHTANAARDRNSPRVVAVLTTRNEERFVAGCLENLFRQGVQVYICDNQSTDRTLEIAQRYRGAGLIGFESIPHSGWYCWEHLLRRKEELFQSLEADWFMHLDADEIHLPPTSHSSLVSAIAAADSLGFNAIESSEFTFIPTREAPDHDNSDYQHTLRTYYPFRPTSPHCVRAYKRQDGPMEIAWSGGHRIRFGGPVRLYPERFRMKHYLFLSAEHAARKYSGRRYLSEEIYGLGWHGWRPRLRPGDIELPDTTQVRTIATDDDLDESNPWSAHWLERYAS
ncbi:glycosyltransferase family 2 protein [Mesorhizobium sp. B2-8-9]|nr:glycosyltransferase family 2 protein [Mesorhizobium sp. B2-8-9]